MKKIKQFFKNWHDNAVNNLMKKSKDKGWTYRKICGDYFDLSLLFTAGILINVSLIIVIIFAC